MRANSLDGLLRRIDPAWRGLLVFGGDSGEVADAIRRILESLAGKSPGGLDVVELAGKDVGSDPARLADEAQSLSLLGGRRLVVVRDADDKIAKAMRGVLDAPAAGNFVLVEAGSLSKGSALRAVFEDHPAAGVLALYEGTPETAAQALSNSLRELGLTIADDARARLIELAGTSSVLLRQEAEKLALYCHGSGTVSLADVEALCGGGRNVAIDELVVAIFNGDLEAADSGFSDLVAAGEDAGRLLSVTHQHALRLVDMRVAVDRGTAAETVVRSARPPVFFKLQPTYVSQLRYWTVEALLSVAASVGVAVRDGRGHAIVGADIAARALLATARKARAQRAGQQR